MRKIVAATFVILLTLTLGSSVGFAGQPVNDQAATKMTGDQLMKPTAIDLDKTLDRHAVWVKAINDHKSMSTVKESKRAAGESAKDFDVKVKDSHPRYQKSGLKYDNERS